jgi:hypothetical protein
MIMSRQPQETLRCAERQVIYRQKQKPSFQQQPVAFKYRTHIRIGNTSNLFRVDRSFVR